MYMRRLNGFYLKNSLNKFTSKINISGKSYCVSLGLILGSLVYSQIASSQLISGTVDNIGSEIA